MQAVDRYPQTSAPKTHADLVGPANDKRHTRPEFRYVWGTSCEKRTPWYMAHQKDYNTGFESAYEATVAKLDRKVQWTAMRGRHCLTSKRRACSRGLTGICRTGYDSAYRPPSYDRRPSRPGDLPGGRIDAKAGFSVKASRGPPHPTRLHRGILRWQIRLTCSQRQPAPDNLDALCKGCSGKALHSADVSTTTFL